MCIRDRTPESPYIDEMKVDQIEMDTGCVKVRISVADRFYYEMLSELTGTHIAGQYESVSYTHLYYVKKKSNHSKFMDIGRPVRCV